MTTQKPTPSQYDTEALHLAAPAPEGREDDASPPLDEEQRDLDDLCERWVNWQRTRRFYGPAPTMGSVLGQLSGSSARPHKAGGPDAANSAELSAFHLAYASQPDDLHKRAFALHYLHRIKPVKVAAQALGISVRHFYRLLCEFRPRVYTASKSILQWNVAARDDLPHGKE